MALFTKDSLENLRQRIDLVEVLSSHVDLKRTGASYKALCPFHDEKNPSFVVQKGDSHYHCFGCGAHGDAIQFLLSHLRLSFHDAVKTLAQQFHVQLEEVENGAVEGKYDQAALKEALRVACELYQFNLFHTGEGERALRYLYARGLNIDFIRRYRLGWAPRTSGVIRRALNAHYIKDSTMLDAGLIAETHEGKWRDFFYDRIMIPICDPHGAIIGFSGRKYREETFGGKYVNTPETPLFKKSRVLFGLNYSRKRIIKERQAIIVEGQLDALRLIDAGFNITVAGQGTAFAEGHAKGLMQLGVNRIYIATDGDDAGKEAACKIGDLFQREGVDVMVIPLPANGDPDAFLRERGAEPFLQLMESALPYLKFLVDHRSCRLNIASPAAKSELVHNIARQVRQWSSPLMVHESLRQLAHLTNIPEAVIGIGQDHLPNVYIKRQTTIEKSSVDADRILEFDCLRWLLLMGSTHPHFFDDAFANLMPEGFKVSVCRTLYSLLIDNVNLRKSRDWLLLASQLEDSEGQMAIAEILHKKVNKERAEEQFYAALQGILNRNWMESREAIRIKIQSGSCSDDEAMDLLKKFDDLKRNPPKVQKSSSKEGADG